MRVVGGAVLLLVVGLAAAAWRPEAASACTGRTLDFKDAIGLSNGAIYAGRIKRAGRAATFWTDLSIDIDLVVRGPAATRLRRAQAGYVCDAILVGQYGYIVRGVRDPQYSGAGLSDLFFRVSGSLTRSDARAALAAAGLPDTSTLPEPQTQPPPAVPWAWLAFWATTASVLASRRLRGRRRRNPVT